MGEFRDHQIDLTLLDPIEGYQLTGREDLKQVKIYLAKWMGRIMDNITKSAFHGYYSKQMSEMESRFFVCNHVILSFHEMVIFLQVNFPVFWRENKKALMHLYQD
jgi:hypothetical protein